MNPSLEGLQSVPELQLCETGTARSFGILLKASQNLSDKELKALEGELRFYTQTGLIGILMSRLLLLLWAENSARAAQRRCVESQAFTALKQSPSGFGSNDAFEPNVLIAAT